jgi:hypothetical protein
MKMAELWVAAPCSLVEGTDVSEVLAASVIRDCRPGHGGIFTFILSALRTLIPMPRPSHFIMLNILTFDIVVQLRKSLQMNLGREVKMQERVK